jgi:hypothetical protein
MRAQRRQTAHRATLLTAAIVATFLSTFFSTRVVVVVTSFTYCPPPPAVDHVLERAFKEETSRIFKIYRYR